jgi:hypothetical protein
MTNLTITKLEFRRAIYAAAICSTVILLICIFASTIPNGPLPFLYFVFRSIGIAASATSLLFGVFTWFAWKWGWLAGVMGKPVLHGVWIGKLQSSFGNGTTVPIVFVISQTYLTVSILSLTTQREGQSRFEAFLRNDRAIATRLGYVFETRGYQPGRNAVVSGAGDLKLLQENTILEGTYWTNDQTHGTLKLKRMTPDIAGILTIADAQRVWNSPNAWVI